MNIARTMAPEWLDTLPPADPRAMQSRRDLQRINALMMNTTFVASELRRAFRRQPPRVIAEIGAGDGTFILRVAEKLQSQWPSMDVVLLDQQSLLSPATSSVLGSMGWKSRAVAADVFAWLEKTEESIFDVIIANLFLHHFDAEQLAELLTLLAQRTCVLIACEPRRSEFALLASHFLGVVGCNEVSRHDAVVSVRAGFKNKELSGLWPAQGGWALRERARGLFSHCFVAARMGDNNGTLRKHRT